MNATRRLFRFQCAPLLVAALLSADAAPNQDQSHRSAERQSPASESQQKDDRIRRILERRLENDRVVPSYHIRTSVSNGVVTLGGRIDNLLARDRAVELARAVRGVREVREHFEILPISRNDSEVQHEIERSLQLSQVTQGADIDAEVQNGVATLSGNVDSWQEKMFADRIARGVPGVRSVENELQFQPKSERPDAEIRREIESRLQWDPYLQDARLSVAVNKGAVELQGWTTSAAGRQRAEENAWITGVRSVSAASVQVRPLARPELLRPTGRVEMNDEQIRTALERTFRYDPRIHSAPAIEVNDGVVTISGTVRTLSAKDAIGENAANLPGIRQIHNSVTVEPLKETPDAQLSRIAQEALKRDAWLSPLGIGAESNEGRVRLEGSVRSEVEKARATEIISGIPGVTGIDNAIRVVESESAPSVSESLESEIREQLAGDPLIESDNVRVEVENQVATLSGTVLTLAARRAAEQDARQAGAVGVINRLTIGPLVAERENLQGGSP